MVLQIIGFIGSVKVSLAMASETLEYPLQGHHSVNLCLSMASETLESQLESHDILKVCLAMGARTSPDLGIRIQENPRPRVLDLED